MTLLLKADRDPTQLVPGVREVLRRIDPELPLAAVSTLEEQVVRAESARRFLLQMLSLFAAVAAALAAVGIYGVMAYLVSRRTREVGVRMAVGADRRDVIALVLRDAAVQILPGLVAGIAGAVFLARFMRSQLYGVSPSDPLTLTAVAVLFTAIALLASWIPARRAAKTDPLEALRAE
jgi:putative ABC transport system permease protein